MILKVTLLFTIFGALSEFVVDSSENVYCQLPCEIDIENVTHTVCLRNSEKCGPAANCGPDFKVIELDDDDRQYILDIHNFFRNKVALGYEKNSKQPAASNMNIMKYNKELEFIAQCWSNSCSGSPLVHDKCRRTANFAHIGQNLGFVNSSNPNIDKINAIKDLIQLWYDEVKIFDRSWVNDTQNRGSNAKVGHYTQMVWADSTDIGCSMTYYSQKIDSNTWYHLIFACNYGPGGNFVGQPLYEIGSPRKNCPNGSEDIGDSIYKGLCGKPENIENAKEFNSIFE